MDDKLSGDISSMDGSLVLNHIVSEAPDDLLARRLKNRERQRRYRARKRHEADLKKASVICPTTSPHDAQFASELMSIPVEVDVSVSLTSSGCLNQVYCPRDWKKDARRAHPHERHELSSNKWDFGVEHDPLTGHCNTSLPANGSTQGLQPGKRDWKAEARNKRSSDLLSP